MNSRKKPSTEEFTHNWTLSKLDQGEVSQYRKDYRLFVAIQLCSVRLHGRFFLNCNDLPVEITNYLCQQLSLPPALSVKVPTRNATVVEQRQSILAYLGFKKIEKVAVAKFQNWLGDQTRQGKLPGELEVTAQQYLMDQKIILPGRSVIERMVINVCNKAHADVFVSVYKKMTPELRQEISKYLEVGKDEQKYYFNQLKEYPPSARA